MNSFLPAVGQVPVGLGDGIKDEVVQGGMQPLADVQQSPVLASSSSFLGTGAKMMPGPLGAGMKHTSTEQQ